ASGLAEDSENVAITSAGALDVALNGSGRVLANGPSAAASAVAASGNNVFVAGTSQSTTDSDFVVAKFVVSGNTASLSWIQTVDVGSTRDVAHGLAVDASGNVLVVGTTVESGRDHVAVVRLLGTNGGADGSFGDAGVVKTSVGSLGDSGHAVSIQPNGQILVVGASRRASGSGEVSDMLAIRYDSSGAEQASNTFNFNSKRGDAEGDDAAYAVVATSSVAYVAGYGRAGRYLNMAFARMESDLSVSSGTQTLIDFGENHHDVANAIAVSGSNVYLGGYTRKGNQNVFAVARLSTSGALQNQGTLAFDGENNGVVKGLVIQEDGKVLAIGYAGEEGYGNAFAVARFSATLTPDLAFATNGRLKLHLGDGADEAAGGVLVGSGTSRRLIVAGSTALPTSGNPKSLAAARFNVAD
ncbi:MAG: hypothetical protein KDD39_14530, partial [Bdellovibrionales bacterium]|nr:hypothetical protein [Bdellovibrionales bacterium]